MKNILKYLSFLLTIVLVISSSVIFVNASSIFYDGFKLDIDSYSKTAKVLDYNGTESDLTIPATVRDFTITSVEEFAFLDNDIIQSVTFNNTVKSIGFMAFARCPNLDTVILPSKLDSMDNSVFYKCGSLKTVYFNSPLEKVPDSTFTDCTSLTYVRLNADIKGIGREAFSGCTSLVDFPNIPSVTTLDGYAFYNTGITKVVLNDNITSVGEGVFKECASLSDVTIYNPEMEIGKDAFLKCAPNLVISGYTGSTAETYCKENNIKFFPLDTVYGDVNNDERINVKDVTYIQKFLAGLESAGIEENSKSFYAADVSGDGNIDIGDALLVLRFVDHEISVFPVEE